MVHVFAYLIYGNIDALNVAYRFESKYHLPLSNNSIKNSEEYHGDQQISKHDYYPSRIHVVQQASPYNLYMLNCTPAYKYELNILPIHYCQINSSSFRNNIIVSPYWILKYVQISRSQSC